VVQRYGNRWLLRIGCTPVDICVREVYIIAFTADLSSLAAFSTIMHPVSGISAWRVKHHNYSNTLDTLLVPTSTTNQLTTAFSTHDLNDWGGHGLPVTKPVYGPKITNTEAPIFLLNIYLMIHSTNTTKKK
jgi:hypothetical protein